MRDFRVESRQRVRYVTPVFSTVGDHVAEGPAAALVCAVISPTFAIRGFDGS
jgi:hypothetical protein